MPQPDQTPAFLAYCPECGGLLGASVAELSSPSLKYAVRDRDQWERAGYRVETQTVAQVHEWQGPLGHRLTCSKARRRKQAQPALDLS